MRRRKIVSIWTSVLMLCLIPATSAFAYFFYDIGSPGFEYPPVAEFSFINGYTFSYDLEGTINKINVEFKFTAPETWGSSYDPYKVSTIFPTETFVGANKATDFNSIYGYFYRIKVTAGSVNSFVVDYDETKATIDKVGYVNTSPTNSNVTDFDGKLNALFSTSSPTHPATDWFFMTSTNWWGWSQASTNNLATGSTQLKDYTYSPSGMIPAPNPEAPTVALFLVGLLGMGWFARMRFSEAGAV